MCFKKVAVWIGITVLALSGCKTNELASVWAHDVISIDGSHDDWTQGLTYIKKQDIAIGIANDGSKLYLTVVISEPRMIARTVMSGLTVWVDGKGRRSKRFGVRYPLPNQAMLMGANKRSRRDRQLGEFPSQERLESLLNSQLNIEMIGPRKDDIHWLPLANDQSIEVSLAFGADGRLIYELSMPLASGDAKRYAPDATPGDQIGVGIEMSAPGMSRKGRRGSATLDGGMPGADLPGGVGGGRGGGRGGGGRGGRMGGRTGGGPGGRSQIAPMEYWAKVKLAAAPQM